MPPLQRERNEPQQLTALRKIMKSGYVTKEAMRAFRRSATNKTGWTAARLDAWLVNLAEGGHLKTPSLNAPTARPALAGRAEEGPAREQAMMYSKVRGWVEKHTEGRISAAHVATMKSNLRGKGGSGLAIEATL